MMIRRIEIPLISPGKSFWIIFQVVCINQDELWGAKSKTKKNDYTIHHGIFRWRSYSFLSSPSCLRRELAVVIAKWTSPPQRLWQSSRFSVLSPHQSRRRYVLDEIYDYVIRKHWYPLSPFDKIQRMFTFPSGGLSIVFIFNYSKKIGIKWRGLSLPRSREAFSWVITGYWNRWR